MPSEIDKEKRRQSYELSSKGNIIVATFPLSEILLSLLFNHYVKFVLILICNGYAVTDFTGRQILDHPVYRAIVI